MTESAGYLLKNLPVGEQVVSDAQYLAIKIMLEAKEFWQLKGYARFVER